MNPHELQGMIDGIDDFVAVVDPVGEIFAINDSWRREAERVQIGKFELGCNYPSDLAALISDGDRRLEPILRAYREVSQGSRQDFQCAYVGAGVLSGNDYRIALSSLVVDGTRYVSISAQDLRELNALKGERRRAHGQILRAQEDERRRIARELHDSAAQSLVALKLTLASLERRREGERPKEAEIVAQCNDAIEGLLREIRSLSFMAHPPSLSSDELSKVIIDLANGFATRTGLNVHLQIADAGEVSGSCSAALYRFAQEGLAAIHRHPDAQHAELRLVGTKRYVHLIISDDGEGFGEADLSAPTMLGVGAVGMRERIKELGGRFSINRNVSGTTLCATVPRKKAQ